MLWCAVRLEVRLLRRSPPHLACSRKPVLSHEGREHYSFFAVWLSSAGMLV